MSSAAKRTFRFLTVRQVALLRLSVLPDSPSQPPLLESALSSPINIRHYTKEQNVFLLAANLAEKLIKNHAFQDGNKRTAMVVADMFLKVNGYKLQDKPLAMDQVNDDIAKAHVAVATREWDAERLGKFYESIATKIEVLTPEIQRFKDDAEEH